MAVFILLRKSKMSRSISMVFRVLPLSCVPCSLPLPLLSHEMVLLVPEENVECRERTVDAGDVLLQVHLVGVGQDLVSVDLLFQDPHAVPHHHDFVEECLDRGPP